VDHAAQQGVLSGLVGLSKWDILGQIPNARAGVAVLSIGAIAEAGSCVAHVADENGRKRCGCLLRCRGVESRHSESENGINVVLSVSKGGIVLVDLTSRLLMRDQQAD
jgi:hypothetical protein